MHLTKLLAVVPVSDLDVATRWYETLLGRPADNRPMDSLADWHLFDDAWLQVFLDPDRAGRTAVNLAVDSVERARATLGERGIDHGETVEATAGTRLLPVPDPDGNVVTLIESPR